MAVTLALFGSDSLRFLELKAQDAIQRTVAPPPVPRNILLIEINDQDLKTLGSWPWPWKYHALLVHALAEAGCGAIVYDVPLSERGAEDASFLIQAARVAGRLWLPSIPIVTRDAASESVPLSQVVLARSLRLLRGLLLQHS